MRGIDRLERLGFRLKQSADDVAEAVATIGNGEQLQFILRA